MFIEELEFFVDFVFCIFFYYVSINFKVDVGVIYIIKVEVVGFEMVYVYSFIFELVDLLDL